MFPQLTDVVKSLIIINVMMFIGTQIAGNEVKYMLAVFYPTSEYFQPYQLITHMFMHANVTHIFFNMYGLFMFGVPLEQKFGSKKFLIYYLLTGFGALLLYMLIMYIQINYMAMAININVPMLGASGAIFGLLAGFGVLFANHTIRLLIPPIPMKAKYFVLIFGVLELYLAFSGRDTGVAHFAHIGGAITGFLIMAQWGILRR